MPSVTAPGVYVYEENDGAHPIQAVGTNIAASSGPLPPPTKTRCGSCRSRTGGTSWGVSSNPPATMHRHRPPTSRLAASGFFRDGGGLCLVVNLGPDPDGARLHQALELLRPRDEVSIVAAPGFATAEAQTKVIDHCELLEDRVAILDPRGRLA